MAKLTRSQQRSLDLAIASLMRAKRYLDRPDVAVAIMGDKATTTLHYTRADGATLYSVAKDIGSDLCGLDFALRYLQQLAGRE